MTRTYSTITAELRNGVLWATIANPPINLIDERFVADLISLLDDTEKDGDVRVVVFRSGDADFFIPHVDLKRIPAYTAEAATSGGPDDISLGALYRRLSEARPVTIGVLEGRARGSRRRVPLRVRHALRVARACGDRPAGGRRGHLPRQPAPSSISCGSRAGARPCR